MWSWCQTTRVRGAAGRRSVGRRRSPLSTDAARADVRNGWVLRSPQKSFVVFAASAAERDAWITHLEQCIRRLRPSNAAIGSSGAATGGLPHITAAAAAAAAIATAAPAAAAPSERPAPVWVRDSESDTCMHCYRTRFTAINRRVRARVHARRRCRGSVAPRGRHACQHHCRRCGIIVCGSCSPDRFVLPNLSSRPVRVCKTCYQMLLAEHRAPHSTASSTTAALSSAPATTDPAASKLPAPLLQPQSPQQRSAAAAADAGAGVVAGNASSTGDNGSSRLPVASPQQQGAPAAALSADDGGARDVSGDSGEEEESDADGDSGEDDGDRALQDLHLSDRMSRFFTDPVV